MIIDYWLRLFKVVRNLFVFAFHLSLINNHLSIYGLCMPVKHQKKRSRMNSVRLAGNKDHVLFNISDKIWLFLCLTKRYRMSKKTKNPFSQDDPEKILQERMKHARRMTREEFVQSLRQKGSEQKKK